MYEPNVNIKNPVEINLLYVQARDGILDGTYPCTVDEACQVCGFILNNHLSEFLPKSNVTSIYLSDTHIVYFTIVRLTTDCHNGLVFAKYSSVATKIIPSHTLTEFKRKIKKHQFSDCNCGLCRVFVKNLGFL